MQNIIKMKRIFYCLLLIPVLCSCNKNNDQNEITYTKIPINASIRDFFFKPGSYWIYKSDATGATDCTYITKVDYGYYDVYKGLHHGESYEYYSMTYISNSSQNIYSYINHIEKTAMLLNPTVGYPYEYFGQSEPPVSG